MMDYPSKFIFVVVGGGVAGVSCIQTLAMLHNEENILLLSESDVVKIATNIVQLTKTLVSFDIAEKDYDYLSRLYPNVTILHDRLLCIDSSKRCIRTMGKKTISYEYLCICTGGQPKFIHQAFDHPDLIVGIRDTDSVLDFARKLSNAEKIVILGNGGIASELVNKVKHAAIDWIIKDNHISSTFIDAGAAEFFQQFLKHSDACEVENSSEIYGNNSASSMSSGPSGKYNGAALGPKWYQKCTLSGACTETDSSRNSPMIHYNTEIVDIKRITTNQKSYLSIKLQNDNNASVESWLDCDILVSATGVLPRVNFECIPKPLNVKEGSGITVNEHMQTSVPYVYAAGDCCHADWSLAKHWFQMKLWTQARQMGEYAAHCMSASYRNSLPPLQDFCFELFAHSTKLFGFKVILLGLFNAQKLNNDYNIRLRMTKSKEYIKLVIQNHKLQGAILIGDTDLEEMCENLILDQLDIKHLEDDILNPNVDIEDYFD